MWQNWQFFMAKFSNFGGKIWQNLGFQMAIFCDASLLREHNYNIMVIWLCIDHRPYTWVT